jgi:hypothetical protein
MVVIVPKDSVTSKPKFNMKNLFRFNLLGIQSLLCSLMVMAIVSVAEAQFGLTAGTNIYNIYAYDGATATSVGTSPAAQGTALPFQFIPGSTPLSGSFSAAPNAGTSVSFVLSPDATSIGTTLSLTYSGTGQDELRLDWMATYINNSGASYTVPTAFSFSISGTANIYAAVAGAETFYNGNGPGTVSAIIQNNGFPAGTYGLSAGPWWGSTSPSFSTTISPLITGSPLNIASGGTLEVAGYLDLVVDPGSIQVTIQATPEPGTLALMFVGAAGIFFGIRKRLSSTASDDKPAVR